MSWHDWIELGKVAGAFFGSGIGGYLAARSNEEAAKRRFRRQDHALEWQNEVLETIAKRSGSEPPPRERLVTLDDPWPDIERQAKKR